MARNRRPKVSRCAFLDSAACVPDCELGLSFARFSPVQIARFLEDPEAWIQRQAKRIGRPQRMAERLSQDWNECKSKVRRVLKLLEQYGERANGRTGSSFGSHWQTAIRD